MGRNFHYFHQSSWLALTFAFVVIGQMLVIGALALINYKQSELIEQHCKQNTEQSCKPIIRHNGQAEELSNEMKRLFENSDGSR